MPDLVDREILKTFAIPSSLNPENFEELASKAFVDEVKADTKIFQEGKNDKKTIYLIEGKIVLTTSGGKASMIASGTEAAKHPIAAFQPRKHTAVSKTNCKLTQIDSDLLDMLMTWDQVSGIEVGEIHNDDKKGGGDWMTMILQSKAFLQVPPANIQAMFMRIHEVQTKAGQAIIKQGDEGDYYYIIKNGKCKVSRQSKTGAALTLATLKDGDAFGEEALLSDAKRNANISMLTDGTLMRLSKQDFSELLKEPMLVWVTREEGDELAKNGAVWIDVRLESEHKNNGLQGSVNMPLFMLRLKIMALPKDKKYILYCDTGRRSSASSFLFGEHGLDAVCLKGGLNGSS